ncbi:MAG: cyclic nucleotide-binding/CBS domain-containing protein [Chloroflexota bacterium]
MLCPVCRHDNFEGEDTCENCGADLRTADIPQPATEYHGRILGEHLEALDHEPAVVEPGTSVAAAIRRMHADGLDCLLVCEGDRLVGIFTDRDAVAKVAGKRLDSFDVRDFMTPDPVVLRADDTLAVAIHKMAVGGFRHIPIIDGDRPVGVVAAPDVFRRIALAAGRPGPV